MSLWEELEPKILENLKEVFQNEDYHNLSLYERRKKIFDYLYNKLEFDLEELHNNSKDTNKQLKDVVFQNKGICNSIIYVYKTMLEKAGVYSLVVFCKDENDQHTIALVDNGDGTLSFDDVSVAILSKQRRGISKENRFDYDLEDAKEMKQGINELYENQFYLSFPSRVVNELLGKKDEYFKSIIPSFVNERGSILEIANYIQSFKKQAPNINKKA